MSVEREIRRIEAAIKLLASETWVLIPIRDVEREVQKALRGMKLKGSPVLIDRHKEYGSTYRFLFRAHSLILDSELVQSRAGEYSLSPSPTKLSYSSKSFIKQAEILLSSTPGLDLYNDFDLTDFPTRKMSFVSADDKRRGEKPVAYFDQSSFDFEFLLPVQE